MGTYTIKFNSVIELVNINDENGVNTHNTIRVADYAVDLVGSELFTALTLTGYKFRGYYISSSNNATTDLISVQLPNPSGYTITGTTTYTMGADYNKFWNLIKEIVEEKDLLKTVFDSDSPLIEILPKK